MVNEKLNMKIEAKINPKLSKHITWFALAMKKRRILSLPHNMMLYQTILGCKYRNRNKSLQTLGDLENRFKKVKDKKMNNMVEQRVLWF